jgi:hypothetical protein
MKGIIAIVSILFLVGIAFPNIIYIPDDYSTIQQGIDASADGDTVLVNAGTYVENINFNGHNTVLGSQYLITGDTSHIGRTVIDGDSSGSVITVESGEDSTTMIAGFTITNGLSANNGGGILCLGSDPQIMHNNIYSNRAQANNHIDKGAGIYCLNSHASIRFNYIHDNVLYGTGLDEIGGGIGCNSSYLYIYGNIIANNQACCGAGVGTWESACIIENNFIYGNMVNF